VTRILIVDDHPVVRTGIEALLRNTEFLVVGTASSGEAAREEIDRHRPDIVLLDLQMPGTGGMEVLRRLPTLGSTSRVILLTAAIDDASLVEAKMRKVSGIVLKDSDPANLLTCLQQVKDRRTWWDHELQQRIGAIQDAGFDLTPVPLTPRERELIGFVRIGLRNRDIAERLGVTEGTVKAYLHTIFEKLGVTSRTQLAIRADELLAKANLGL
jgi:two-component system nitrate/nitrite response regulator NarL